MTKLLKGSHTYCTNNHRVTIDLILTNRFNYLLAQTNSFLTNHTCPNENYQYVTTDTFLTVIEKHALLKKKIVRGNQKL